MQGETMQAGMPCVEAAAGTLSVEGAAAVRPSAPTGGPSAGRRSVIESLCIRVYGQRGRMNHELLLPEGY
jgi:hypothetical protein